MRVQLQLTPIAVGSSTVYVDLVVSSAGGRYVAAQGQMSMADAHELAKMLKRSKGIEIKYMNWAQLAHSP